MMNKINPCQIMGVLNCTPDSFSDGGLFFKPQEALRRAEKMLRDGANIIDIGAESTRPNSLEVPAEEEIKRLMQIVPELLTWQIPLSIDTKKTAVMAKMLDLGVHMINDVRALEDNGALELLSRYEAKVCLMHMRGMPENMQNNTNYQDVVAEVYNYLQQRAEEALLAGISKERIILDFGFGFGKTPQQNMQLIKAIPEFKRLGFPLLVGVSRKSTIGHYLQNAPVEKRLFGSITLAALSASAGANFVRVHDVAETRDALAMVYALQNA